MYLLLYICSSKRGDEEQSWVATPSCSPVETTERERSSRRDVVRYSCAVESCRNDGKSVDDSGGLIQFFEIPQARGGKHRKVRTAWAKAVPGIRDAALPQHRKVCQEHFVQGKPTETNPAPELKLSDETPQFLISRKEKSEKKKVVNSQSGIIISCMH